MKKSELKDLVFERYEKSREEILEKLLQFRDAYGDEAIRSLGEALLVGIPPQAVAAESMSSGQEGYSSAKRRKAKKRPPRAGTIRALLDEQVPMAVAALGASGQEFVVRDVYEYLTTVLKAGVTRGSLSLYLGQHVKQLGLLVDKRLDGEPIKRPTNFFRLRTQSVAAPSDNQSASVDRVDWPDRIISALRGSAQGYTAPEIVQALITMGLSKPKFRSSGFRKALKRLHGKGEITLEDKRYRIK